MAVKKTKVLSELLDGVAYELLQGDLQAEISDVAYDSRKVSKGFLFVAIAGTVSDGHKYIKDVIDKGAAAVAVEKDIEDIEKEYGFDIDKNITVIKLENGRSGLSLISQNYFDHPMKKMVSIGITGTKGKSTTTYLIKNILEQTGKKCGIIGTIGVAIGDKVTPIEHTTPESYDLQEYIADIAEAGCEYFVMEVSSQGVKMDRVAGMRFDYGIFTNITPDHIGKNEHEDFNDYLNCKSRLFDMCSVGIFNADDPHTAMLIRGAHCLVKTYGLQGSAKTMAAVGNTTRKDNIGDLKSASDSRDIGTACEENDTKDSTYGAYEGILDEQYLSGCEQSTGKRDLVAVDVEHINDASDLGMSFGLRGLINRPAYVGLPGLFNVYNALSAVTLGALIGVDDDSIIKAIKHVEVRGRVEAVPTGKDFSVLIDFAHNGVSTESVLRTLRGYDPHRLIAIFGCGGNRSKLRRYEMGEAAGRLADFCVVTSDNPRTEQFSDIVDDIKVGLNKADQREGDDYIVIEDRMEAVAYAVSHAVTGDMIVLLGKGHEEYQEIQGVKHHYSEREAVAAALAALSG